MKFNFEIWEEKPLKSKLIFAGSASADEFLVLLDDTSFLKNYFSTEDYISISNIDSLKIKVAVDGLLTLYRSQCPQGLLLFAAGFYVANKYSKFNSTIEVFSE